MPRASGMCVQPWSYLAMGIASGLSFPASLINARQSLVKGFIAFLAYQEPRMLTAHLFQSQQQLLLQICLVAASHLLSDLGMCRKEKGTVLSSP